MSSQKPNHTINEEREKNHGHGIDHGDEEIEQSPTGRREKEEEEEDEEEEVEFEVESIIDSVSSPTTLYRVQWRNYHLQDCTWEPEAHLDKASQVVEQYLNALKQIDPNDPNLQRVRANECDLALLEQVWDYLTYPQQISNERFRHMMEWLEEGSGFKVNDTALVTEWLQSKDCAWLQLKEQRRSNEQTSPTTPIAPASATTKEEFCRIGTYEEFAFRLAVLGFEEMLKNQLFHHPSFNRENKEWIRCIGQHSIPNKFTSTTAKSSKLLKSTPEHKRSNQILSAKQASGSKTQTKTQSIHKRKSNKPITAVDTDLHLFPEDEEEEVGNDYRISDEDFDISLDMGAKRRKSKRISPSRHVNENMTVLKKML